MTLTSKTVSTLLAKLYTALSHIDLTEGGARGGMMLDYKMSTRTISVRANGQWHPLLVIPADADVNAFASDGRKTWRSIKKLVAIIEAKAEEEMALCLEEMLDTQEDDNITDEEMKDILIYEGWDELPSMAHLVRPHQAAAYQSALIIWHTITQDELDVRDKERIATRLETEALWAMLKS